MHLLHQPSPIALHTPLPLSRAASPAPQFATASTLKSEHLLRSTLRRADQAVAARSRTSSFARSRSTTPAPVVSSPSEHTLYVAPHHSLIADSCASSALDDDDDLPLQLPASSPLRRSSTVTPHLQTPVPRRMSRAHSPSPADSVASSAGSKRQRPGHSPRALSISSYSPQYSPITLKHPTPLRPGPMPTSRSDPTASAFTPSNAGHENALKQRLQGVLDAHPLPVNASHAQKALRSVTGPNFSLHAHSERRQHARSRSASVRVDGDAAWWPPSGTSPASPTTELSLSSRSASRSRNASSRESLSGSVSGPSTPPSPTDGFAALNLAAPRVHNLSSSPTDAQCSPGPQTPERPKFDVRTASKMCRNAPGLVSFRDVEGLGAPSNFYDADEEDEEDKTDHSWFAWGWTAFGRSPAKEAKQKDATPSATAASTA